jgi:SRSO17 transposase
MDHYEVRTWEAWYRYITLCLLVDAFLVVTRLAASREDTGS